MLNFRPSSAATVLLVVVATLMFAAPAALAAPVAGATASATSILHGDTLDVTLTLDGETVVESTPTDLVFVIDESGSITPPQFTQLKAFVGDLESDLNDAGIYANGGRVGVVQFDSDARTWLAPSTNHVQVANAIGALFQQGQATCIGCGMILAKSLLEAVPDSTGHNRVMVVITDGNENRAPTIATALGSGGAAAIERFAVGIGNSVSQATLNQIAQGQTGQHTFAIGDFGALGAAVESIVGAVNRPGATDVRVELEPAAPFSLVAGSAVASTGGTATETVTGLTWTLDSLGDETVTLSYTLASTLGACGLGLPLHSVVTYADAEGAVVAFPALAADVTGCAVADAGPDQVVEQTSPAGADVTLDGTGSSGSGLTFTWSVPGGATASGATPTVLLAPGTTTVELSVTDGVATSADTVDILVQDTLAPTIDGSAAPAPNAAGWNNTPVGVTFTCADSGSGVAVCGPDTTVGEGAGETVVGAAEDHAGNPASATVGPLAVDLTAPEIAFSGATSYALTDEVAVSCSATDALSGIAADCTAGAAGPAWTFGAGDHTLTGSATDVADNAASADFTFIVVVDADGLCELTRQFNDKAAVGESMCTKLEHGQYDAYRNHVEAQSGKSLTESEAATLLALVDELD